MEPAGRGCRRGRRRVDLLVLVATSVAVLMVGACATTPTGQVSTDEPAAQPATPAGPARCLLADGCKPAAVQDVSVDGLPADLASRGGLTGRTMPDGLARSTRTWVSSKPSFQDPSGQPIGRQVVVTATTHAAADELASLGLDRSPRAFGKVKVGDRIAFASNWMVTSRDLDGDPLQVPAVSIYVAVSSTLLVQIDTLGFSTDEALDFARGVGLV